MEIIQTSNSAETEKAGAHLAKLLVGKREDKLFFVALYGELGAGKTAFCRGIASVVSPESRVKSPSYTIVNEYLSGGVPLYHMDLYRLSGADELESFGYDEYLQKGHCVVEWSEKLDELPEGAVIVRIEKLDGERRKITVDGI